MLTHIVLDVDGTLTDSGVYYDNYGNELKKFSTKDGAGFFIARAAGIKLIILTGRESEATTRRMTELKADIIQQNIKDKAAWLREYMTANGVDRAEIGYIGDDVNDLPPMRLCGFVGCPADACKEVKATADYVSPLYSGHGAARDVIEYLLTKDGRWSECVEKAYGSQA
ncbi:MAG: HAD hydrolase family protein [Treponema sp.]|jgi:3-deoxy-D-manno-octulosonate 8-phosphate phosphatase (KDO 8-P phosphatase)|nr:HAD hydrolase family protein [Treponema sp.]